ncbi:uncharacterized protein LOC117646826 [Thrips palmi]|uniref:Uncharacterized protein LOC117646826 n=1 Tax=Thrips palmi TaxID=161013 RepID=A0A6P8YV50_THRPL|nr:uncharacterized protein LOC117646826 [Thrips palmi]XP_034243958.1 uncharacterized protein LOC117646826 [Thrips palmi]XP_034243959.1 uncharacterized protein LOC117646826 [Thrips palmi]XP_034243960.1 uncharacterized protein LOC117646826 [Thrips palmi]XP_034243962.1 uncharacterized protein LOC117646826 [Thrips palmi]XP_034243963.1 uncharacterized protein LOC117646826 [Thrips palmi]XP_034243964.1 uncharacterized protein LOC117646826 [Thrips palmi]XP_034243965.1 uncharacterized protein LOC1176
MAQLQRSCLPIVDQGCCCDLKTCCKVQGWLQVVGCILSIISSIHVFASVPALCQDAAEKGVDCFEDEKMHKMRLAAAVTIEGIDVVIQVIFLLSAVFFLVGISQGEPSKMVHYIRMMWINLCWGIIFTIVSAVVVTPLSLIFFVLLGVQVYCLICANSLHVQMVADRKGPYTRQTA